MTDVERINAVTVTTGEGEGEIIGPVYFQTTNRGFWGLTPFHRLKKRYKSEPFSLLIPKIEPSPKVKVDLTRWVSRFDLRGGFEGSVGSRHFDAAFYMTVAELKRRVLQAGGDSLTGFRYEWFLDTQGYSCFYVQGYGTARRKNGEE